MQIRKILSGIDFGKETEKVISYSAFFAKTFNASLDLLYVIDYLMTPPMYLQSYIKEESKEAFIKLNNIKELLSKSEINTQTKILSGRLQESFQKAIKKSQADLVILGFVHHPLRRSSSEKLIKSLKIPMLVVKGKENKIKSFEDVLIKKILCPYDFSEISEKALIEAANFASLFGSELDVIHVLPEFISNKKIKKKIRYDELLKPLYEETINNILEILKKNNINANSFVYEGEPSEKIILHAKRKDMDLIVIGARGLGLIKGLLIGSVTDSVLKKSDCPVLIIH
ncbi:MAG: universal stress protein [Nitrospirae bacterium]|jgi:nucleotide-binding universal stress UspA family protein|nr:universal stress protein [Nitrospirota bacterium]